MILYRQKRALKISNHDSAGTFYPYNPSFVVKLRVLRSVFGASVAVFGDQVAVLTLVRCPLLSSKSCRRTPFLKPSPPNVLIFKLLSIARATALPLINRIAGSPELPLLVDPGVRAAAKSAAIIHEVVLLNGHCFGGRLIQGREIAISARSSEDLRLSRGLRSHGVVVRGLDSLR